MTTNAGEPVRRKQSFANIYRAYKARFDVDEFIENPALIKMLNEDKEIAWEYVSTVEDLLNDEGARSDKLEKQLEDLKSEKQRTDIELAKATLKIEEANRNSFIQFLVSTAATVLVGFGVGILTATPNDWKGWLLLVIGFILSIIAFFIVGKGK